LEASKNVNSQILEILKTTIDFTKSHVTIFGDLWCLFNCDAGDDDKGIYVKIIEEALKTVGLEVECKVLPWNRALRSVRNGKTDIILCISAGPLDILRDNSLGFKD
jgi:hypothetical protein